MAVVGRLFFILKIMTRQAVAPSATALRAVWKRTVGPKVRIRRARLVLLCAMLGAVPVADIAAGERGSQQPGPESALATSQKAIGREIGDYVFTTTLNRPLRLSDYRGKPVVLNLVYTSCADICPTVSETLARAVAVGQDTLGSDSFRVVSVGFDTRNDTPQRMQAFARRHGLQLRNWDFLSADPDTIDGLSRDVGFLFWPGPQGFNHVSQTTIIDPEGRVYRQIYGSDFDPPLLIQPLKELVLGRRSSLDSFAGVWTKVRLICTVYDPASGRYQFSYAIFIGAIVGAICLGAVGVVLGRLWWRNRHAGAAP
jgi:protein SCO1/2